MKVSGVGSWIEARARIDPNAVAIVWGEDRRTYGELAARIRRLGSGLRRLGVQGGDRVVWLGPNHPAFLETLFASAKLGAVLSPLNHRLDQPVLQRILEDCAPSVAVIDARVADLPTPPTVRTRVLVSDEGESDYEALIAGSSDELWEAEIELDDLCMLPYTSGTTGSPKGVMLTHGNVTWNVVNLLSCTDFLSDDVTIAIAPFFRVGGTGVNVLPVLFKGGAVVVPPTVDPEAILELIDQHRVTVGFGNPDLLEALTHSRRWSQADLSSVRFFITGGAPVPERLIHTFSERGVTFVQGYGLSEAAPVVLLLDRKSALKKAGSAGKPPPLIQTRIERPDGSESPAGETGELYVRGPNVMAGYWNRADATSATIDAEGWLRTGDAARADEDGYIWIVDRVKDAFVSSGEVIYPGDIERVLALHPLVAEAAVLGVRTDEEVVGRAVVVPMKGAALNTDELIDFCRERLKPAQMPHSITVVAKLPRNTVGKLLRHELQALL